MSKSGNSPIPGIIGDNGKYKVQQFFDKGTFSKLVLACNKQGKNVVIKLEPSDQYHYLKQEYEFLLSMAGKRGLPMVFEYIPASGDVRYNAMVMEELGPNLEKLFKKCGKFTLKTTVQLAVQMFNLIEFIHSRHIVHCDLKPENFLVCHPKNEAINDGYCKNLLYLIDFGMSKKFVEDGEHIKPNTKCTLYSPARYASINAHLGKPMSRRDDLEALGYVLVYFVNGKLPWMSMAGPNVPRKDVWKLIGERKRSSPIEVICNNCPDEFASYLRYVRNIQFEDAPDYEYIRSLLTELYDRCMCDNEYDFKCDIYDKK